MISLDLYKRDEVTGGISLIQPFHIPGDIMTEYGVVLFRRYVVCLTITRRS